MALVCVLPLRRRLRCASRCGRHIERRRRSVLCMAMDWPINKVRHRHRPYRQGGKPDQDAAPEKLPEKAPNKSWQPGQPGQVARGMSDGYGGSGYDPAGPSGRKRNLVGEVRAANCGASCITIISKKRPPSQLSFGTASHQENLGIGSATSTRPPHHWALTMKRLDIHLRRMSRNAVPPQPIEPLPIIVMIAAAALLAIGVWVGANILV
jgi:hypothetical protein